jgi:uncharacterized protein (TIGR02611 family)
MLDGGHRRCGISGMLRFLRLQWRDLACGQPGTRFRQRWRAREQRRRSYFAKPLYMAAGFCVFLVGLVMLPAPGPGCLVVFAGAAMIAEESFSMATLLDRIELKGRRMLKCGMGCWARASMALKAVSFVLAAAVVGVAGWTTLQIIT